MRETTELTVSERTAERIEDVREELAEEEPHLPEPTTDEIVQSLIDTREVVKREGYGGDAHQDAHSEETQRTPADISAFVCVDCDKRVDDPPTGLIQCACGGVMQAFYEVGDGG
jgi:hypothetical protein